MTLRPAPWCLCCSSASSRAPLSPPVPSSCSPRPAPSEQRPPSLPSQAASLPSQAAASLPTSAPRSGRLLVPRPQSPFDPLLGSEPCDPVGGPPRSASSAADSPLPGESRSFVLPSFAPRWGASRGCAPDGYSSGGAGSLGGPGPGLGRQDSPGFPGEGWRGTVSTRGPDFRSQSRRKGLCVVTAISL